MEVLTKRKLSKKEILVFQLQLNQRNLQPIFVLLCISMVFSVDVGNFGKDQLTQIIKEIGIIGLKFLVNQDRFLKAFSPYADFSGNFH